MTTGPQIMASQRSTAMQSSLIRTIAEKGMGQQNILPMWFGEGCWPSSEQAVEAAAAALRAGDHFYQPNSGRLSLRQAIAEYQSRLYGSGISSRRITVTASGMQGLALAAQAIADHGDRVVVLGPVWPNLAECFKLVGARVETVSLTANCGRWQLDMQRLLDKLTSDTTAVLVNSPNNPTGWVMQQEEQLQLLEHCRRHGIWIVADEVYARLCRGSDHAPSFLGIASDEDRLIAINSFSKTWSMTGWRLGWITAPPAFESVLADLTEFNIAGPAGFIQRAGEVMLQQGEAEVRLLQQRLTQAYTVLAERLAAMNGLSFLRPDGAFYCFFAIDGMSDSMQGASSLLAETGLGLAPGRAFGPEGEGHLRLCYAQPPAAIHDACDRLQSWLDSR